MPISVKVVRHATSRCVDDPNCNRPGCSRRDHTVEDADLDGNSWSNRAIKGVFGDTANKFGIYNVARISELREDEYTGLWTTRDGKDPTLHVFHTTVEHLLLDRLPLEGNRPPASGDDELSEGEGMSESEESEVSPRLC